MPKAPRYIAVIGKGTRCPAPVCQLARETGRQLALLHPEAVLICGGLSGVMEAAAEGMTTAGGVAIGLVPAGYEGNKHLTYAIRLGLPVLFRDIVTASAADLVVMLPGSHGTVIEGWAAAERGLPILSVGDHAGWPTAQLPATRAGVLPAQLPAMAADLLGLRVTVLDTPEP